MSRQRYTQHTLALIAAAQSGAAHVHGDSRSARAFWNAATLLLTWPSDTIQPHGDGWRVPSARRPDVRYTVRQMGGVLHCSCPSGRFGKPCKHAALIEVMQTHAEENR